MVTETEHLLVHNVLNEVLHGLQRTASVRRLLLRRQALDSLFRLWEETPDIVLAHKDRVLLAAATRVAMEELGDEFSIRIGTDIPNAERFLKRLQQRN